MGQGPKGSNWNTKTKYKFGHQDCYGKFFSLTGKKGNWIASFRYLTVSYVEDTKLSISTEGEKKIMLKIAEDLIYT